MKPAAETKHQALQSLFGAHRPLPCPLCQAAWHRDLQAWYLTPTQPSAGFEAQSWANLASNPGSATCWLFAIEEITSCL